MDFLARVPRLGAVAPDGDAPSTTGIDVWCAHPFIDRGLPLRNVLDTDAGLDKQQRSILSPEHDAIYQRAYLATPALLRYKNITRGSMLSSLPPQLPVCAHTDKEVAAMVDSRSQLGDHLARHSVAARWLSAPSTGAVAVGPRG